MATGQQYLVNVTVAGQKLPIASAITSGGGVTAPVSKYRPGGLGAEVVESAPPTYDDMTITIGNEKTVFWTSTMDWLCSVTGFADMHVDRQPLDPGTKKPVGPSRIFLGTLSGAAPGAVDANDSSTEMITLTMAVVSSHVA